jgi:hypothetical protein
MFLVRVRFSGVTLFRESAIPTLAFSNLILFKPYMSLPEGAFQNSGLPEYRIPGIAGIMKFLDIECVVYVVVRFNI